MSNRHSSRRDFVKKGASVAAVGAFASTLAHRAHAEGDDTIKVGLIGAGGRGSGAAAQALSADPKAKLVAVADLFMDRAQDAAKNIKNEKGDQVDLPPERVYAGFDAYKQVTDQVDVVLLCTTPHYRPIHLEYAVEKGKHVFAEKPVAADAAGLRRCLAAARKAKEKGLSLVSGLCYRYEHKKRQLIQQIHDGTIGDTISAETYYLTGTLWYRGNKPEWSPMELQNRNWYYYTWLSGDHIAEQHVHSLDKIAWAFGDEYPVRAISTGGRIARTDERYGNIYDHFSTVFQYASGRVAHSYCRQIAGAFGRVDDNVYGTKGMASIQQHFANDREGKQVFKSQVPRGESDNMYQNEHDELFASIRKNEPIYNGDYMCNSTMMAVMARMSAYTGQIVSWDQAWNSQENLGPATYEWGAAPAGSTDISIPGQAKLI